MVSMSGLDLSFMKNKPVEVPPPLAKRKRGRPKKVAN